MHHPRADVRIALRQLALAPAFSVAAIGTLAIGVGATVALLSVIMAVIVRPFPFPDPDRVLNLHPARNGVPLAVASNLEFATWRALPRAFDGVVAIANGNPLILERGDGFDLVTGGRATAEFTRVFGLVPALGRAFGPDDDRPGAPHVVMLGHRLWVRDFGGQSAVLGRHIRMSGDSYEVIGVLPASFDAVTGGNDLWTPLALSTTDLQEFKVRNLQVVARLALGTTLSQANDVVAAAERQLAAQYPMWGSGYTAQVRRFADDVVDAFRRRLFVLLGASAFVFLIACVNVANLLLARGTTRSREIGVRIALGATRRRLIQQLLTESAVLSTLGSVAGLGLAFIVLHVVVATSPPGVPRIEEAQIDGSVLLLALIAGVLCTLLVGLLPALRATGPAVTTVRGSGHAIGEGRTRGRARAMLMGAEVALAMTLLAGAGLLIRTAWALNRVDPGFESSHVLTAQLLLPPARYPDLPTAEVAYRAIRESVARIPGVEQAALTASLPLAAPLRAGIGPEGRPYIDGERTLANVHVVSPDYFGALQIRFVGGRDFRVTDNARAPNVTVINEALARKFWPGEQAIGKRMEGMDPSHQHFMLVVGVIADTRDVALSQSAAPAFYIPFEQTPPPLWNGLQGALSVVARTTGAPATVARPLHDAVASVDATLPFGQVATMEQLVWASQATGRFNTILLTALGAIALVLASVGVYGVVGYAISQRRREIGLRMALGATPSEIVALVIRQGVTPIVLGTVAGGILSAGMTRFLREQLYGVAPGDPTTILTIAAVLLAVSLLAAFIPTRRAVLISPVTALAT